MTTQSNGPAWSNSGSGRYAGRFPLSVERHVLSTVDVLSPGITTTTTNARYMALHGLVCDRAQSRDLDRVAAQQLMRRSEVVLGAISYRHSVANKSAHAYLPAPHGAGVIGSLVRAGTVDPEDAARSQTGSYSANKWGFWSAYRGAEAVLRIVDQEDDIAPGAKFDRSSIAPALEGIFDLVDSPLTTEALDRASDLCVCQMSNSNDGAWLAAVLTGSAGTNPGSIGSMRRQTMQLIVRASQLQPIARASDLNRFVAFDPRMTADETLAALDVSAQWRGLVLRNYAVSSWRRLWAWIVGQVVGMVHIDDVADLLASQMPAGTVGQFLKALPPTRDSQNQPLAAEFESAVENQPTALHALTWLCLGALRMPHLSSEVLHGYQGHNPRDIAEELAPAWFAQRLAAAPQQPMSEFARDLCIALVLRSQRLAMRKARLNHRTGRLAIPTRLYFRDQYLFRDSAEGNAPASLRWDSVLAMMTGVGLMEVEGKTYRPGPRAGHLD